MTTLAPKLFNPKWFSKILTILILTLSTAAGIAEPEKSAPLFDETGVTTLFAFDQKSIPFTENLRIHMEQPKKYPGNPVVKRGPAGSPDSWAVQFYGSVVRVGDEFRMWYACAGDDRLDGKDGKGSRPWSVAYAVSEDGINWTKPNLGLVEFEGNKNNNLVNFGKERFSILNVKVIHEPDSPADQRFKMTAHIYFRKSPEGRQLGNLGLFVSADGLNWKSATGAVPQGNKIRLEDLVLPWNHYEPAGGLYKWDGLYYTSGQNANPAAKPLHGRVVRSFVSGDFVNWSSASAVTFIRSPQRELLGPGRSREGEQTHEGLSVWNRKNVLLGVVGIWHGAKEWPGVTIDLGFVVGNDGVSFREPAHEWVFIKRGKDKEWDQGGLLQGQGFENIGEQTFVYYGAWDPRHWKGSPPRGGVGIVTVPRDRFGDLRIYEKAIGEGEYQVAESTGSFLTEAVPLAGQKSRRFFLNADGLGENAALKIELLDRSLKPLPGYSGSEAALVRQNGFQSPISWQGKTELSGLPEELRIRVTYEGDKKYDIRFYALYMKDGES